MGQIILLPEAKIKQSNKRFLEISWDFLNIVFVKKKLGPQFWALTIYAKQKTQITTISFFFLNEVVSKQRILRKNFALCVSLCFVWFVLFAKKNLRNKICLRDWEQSPFPFSLQTYSQADAWWVWPGLFFVVEKNRFLWSVNPLI